MYTIGEFSNLCMVTTKTLRHYDNIGLLRPAHISGETGYRYYEASQFRDMFFILKCKDYGFTLDEISSLLHAEAHVVAARFAAKYTEQGTILTRHQELMRKMREDMEQLEKGIDIMSTMKTEIKLVETKPVEIVSERDVISMKDFGKMFGKVMDKLKANKLECTGGLMAIYYCEEFNPESSDVEIGAIVSEKSGVTRTFPGQTCAMGVHLGAYSSLGETYAAIAKWIEENGYEIADAPYDKYLNSPYEVPEDKLVTEIYFPVRKK